MLMKIKNIISNSIGFTIPEVMIAVGLMGVAAMGTMKMMENSTKASKNMEIKDNILQVQREVNDILSNPNNCEATLGGRTVGGQVPIIYQVIEGVPTSKYSAGSTPISGVEVVGMKVKSIDNNGSSDGSQVLAVLELDLRKKSMIAIGGSILKKEIRVNANLCKKDMVDDATLAGAIQKCKGAGKKLLEGPHLWNGSYWAVCQDCSGASANIIRSCQSNGGGGVDVTNMSKMQCQNMGGVFDDTTLSCNIEGVATEAACTSLGGVYQASVHACTFSGAPLANFIGNKIDSLMPSCIVSPVACSGIHGTKMGEYIVKEDTIQNYTWYTVTCKAHFRRVTSNWVKKQWCAGNYNQYAHCGPNGPRVHQHEVCTAQGRSSGVRCSNNYGQRHHDNCFQFDYDACSVTNTQTRSETIQQEVRLNKCCK